MLYVLDEPSIGLHQRDNRRLIDTLVRLRDLGNTLIVVEHDLDTIAHADWVVDIGPAAGEHGGRIVHSGTYDGSAARTRIRLPAPIFRARSRSRSRDPAARRPQAAAHGRRCARAQPARDRRVVPARGADLGHRRLRLGQVDAGQRHPGVGAGQQAQRRPPGARPAHPGQRGWTKLDKLVRVDQSPIGRTPRSNPATYTGVFDKIRTLFAATTEAKVRGYQPGRFSFNVKGGRCEACSGDGTIKIEMNFLPDVYVPCEVCHGARYNRETLEVHYKGKTIAEVLDMSIEEAAEFFAPITSIHRYLQDAGRRRPRLRPAGPAGADAVRRRGAARQAGLRAAEAVDRSHGLHPRRADHRACTSRTSASCSMVINGLVDKGNTVIVIEHNLDVIKTSDWIIDMGPEGGPGGGTVVATGHAGGRRRQAGELHRPVPGRGAGRAEAVPQAPQRSQGQRLSPRIPHRRKVSA